MTTKNFKVSREIEIFFQNLLNDSLRMLYAPQCIHKLNAQEKDDVYLGQKVYISTYGSNKIMVLDQYTLNDNFLISEKNNMKLSLGEGPLVNLQPEWLEKGFYFDFTKNQIYEIDLFAHLSYQKADNELAEICITNDLAKPHYFIHISCSYILRFYSHNLIFNLMLDNDRYFSGANDFVSRFRILDNDTVEKLINAKGDKSSANDSEAAFYKKIFSFCI